MTTSKVVFHRIVSTAFASVLAGTFATAADCNGNGADDGADISAGVSQDCNSNGVPDECDVARRLEPRGILPLGRTCMFFMAWPRDTVLASGDLDGDGDPDLVTANCGLDEPDASVSVFLDQGDGTFAPETLFPTGTRPTSLVLEDLDGDGDDDVATGNFGSEDVTVLLNQGNGTFSAPRSFSIDQAIDLAAADFDGDSDIDLAVCRYASIEILLNTGNGDLAQGPSIATQLGGNSFYPKKVAAADLDGDGDVDLIAGDNALVLWRNAGGAVFGEPSSYAMTEGNHGFCWPHAILAVDLNGDGREDIVSADYTDGGTPSVSTLINLGNFDFSGPTPYFLSFNDECQHVDAADLDRDGDVDLVAVGGDSVAVLSNRGDGILAEPRYHVIGHRASVVLTADIDLDEDRDILVKRWVNDAREIVVLENEATSMDVDGNGIPDECEPSRVLVNAHEEWAFFRGRSAPPSDWADPAFEDSAWERGLTGIGYGDGDDLTVLDDMQGAYVAVFCRKGFEVSDPAAVKSLLLQVDFDDGLVAYLNGIEVARANMPSGTIPFDGAASTGKEAGRIESFDISPALGFLIPGRNVLAVEVHNTNVASSDLSFIPRLKATVEEAEPLHLAVSSTDVREGSTGDVRVLLTSVAPVQAFSFGISHDPAVAVLEAIDIEACPEMEALNDGAGPEIFEFDLDAGTASCESGERRGGTVYAVVSSVNSSTVVPAGVALPVVHLHYRAAPGVQAGAGTSLEIVGCLGDFRPWATVVTIEHASRTPSVSEGALTIVEASRFLRGDPNDDGRLDISDSVTVLSYLFHDLEIPCASAADANDDGAVDISDAVRVLIFLFRSPDPLPEPCSACGYDPTADDLPCLADEPCGE